MWLFCFSIDKVPKVMSPTLVIHGTEDEVIDFSHGLTIFERCPRAVEPLWVEVSRYIFNSVLLYYRPHGLVWQKCLMHMLQTDTVVAHKLYSEGHYFLLVLH